jgi:hypothetical protein
MLEVVAAGSAKGDRKGRRCAFQAETGPDKHIEYVHEE